MKEENSRTTSSQSKYGYNMAQYDLPDKFGDLPNVSDTIQQRNASTITIGDSANLNTFKDSAQNSNGAGRILAQQKSSYGNLPENAQGNRYPVMFSQ